MSNLSRKLMMGAAGAAGEKVYVEDVFSTYLYTGNDSTQTITNGVDLAGEGGLVWLKNRDYASNHILTDSERGINSQLRTNETGGAEGNDSIFDSFNSDGFSIDLGNSNTNANGHKYVSWTFRKAEKFFDVVTYTGTGSAQTIAHNLGTTVGTLIVKRTDSTGNWGVFHRSEGPSKYGLLHDNAAFQTDEPNAWNGTAPTDTEFSVGAANVTNTSGATYVAYLFAHNAGGFGDAGTDNVISCGSYTTNGSGEATVNLGYEPQWVLWKQSNASTDWYVVDNMRGWNMSRYDDVSLRPNLSNSDYAGGYGNPTATGFFTQDQNASAPHIYIAIRRGPMRAPESGTEVFDVENGNGGGSATTPEFVSGFPVDAALGFEGLAQQTTNCIQGLLQTSIYPPTKQMPKLLMLPTLVWLQTKVGILVLPLGHLGCSAVRPASLMWWRILGMAFKAQTFPTVLAWPPT
jgi:hypothetical protein